MAMINIRKTSDTFERYKMPKLVAKIEGRGNGIKTVIVNMVDISRALKRPPLYPTKFFGCELGAQIQVDTKNERYIVNGAHTAERLQELLYGFIEKYVLCTGCGNPETQLQINSKKQVITAKCIACGHTGQVEAVSRFSSFLIKHPPDQTESPVVAKKETKKEGKSSKKSGKTEQNGNGSAGFGSQDSGEHADDNDDDDWLEDTEEEARRRQEEQQLSEHVRNLIMTDESEKTEEEKLDIFYAYCKNLQANGQLILSAKMVFERADALAIKDKAPLLLMDLLVSLKNFQKDLEGCKHLLHQFTYKNVRAQRNLLGGVEKLVAGLTENEIKQRVPPLLQVLYMADVVEEQGFYDWDKKASSRYVGSEQSKRIHAAAQPFMAWLKEAEEEESDEEAEPEIEEEEEADSDLHVDFSHSGKAGVVEVIQTAGTQEGKKETMEDLDIDNI